MDISKKEFTDMFSKLIRTNAFLYPFIEYGKRYFSEQELMEIIHEKREFPYPEHTEFSLYCAGYKDPELDERYLNVGKDIAKYAGFSDEEVAQDIQKNLDKLENDDVNEWIESVDVVKKDHKSKTMIEVLENLYHIGNGSALKEIREHGACSYRILTSSIRLLFNTENMDSIFEFVQEISRCFTTNSQIAEIYKSITKICYEEEIHLKNFLQAFSMSESYTKFRVLSNIDLFRDDVASKLSRISQDCDAKDVARMANDYLAKG